MKFTLSWLKAPLDTNADAATVADKLTSIGLEVESVEDAGARLKDFTVAYVISAEKHPNADKLKLCMVDTGAGEPVQVVCGAPNAHTGMKAVFAPPLRSLPSAPEVVLMLHPFVIRLERPADPARAGRGRRDADGSRAAGAPRARPASGIIDVSPADRPCPASAK